MGSDRDDGERITATIAQAAAQRRPLSICGSGTKSRRYRSPTGVSPTSSERLSTLDHCGILHYAPDELVLEARAGTPLTLIEQQLAQQQQMLAFEPPRYRGGGTLGGAVATGLSGPARPWRGALRDAVLGVEMVNGLGERLRFGGRVVKNVAGYDLSRLQAGAFGTFGCLLSVCVRVMPQPMSEATLQLELPLAQALERMASWTRCALPLAGSCYYQGQLSVRLLGAVDSVAEAAATIGGERRLNTDIWSALRDQTHPFFASDARLWRVSVPLGTGALPYDESALIEWGGAQRWYPAGRCPDADVVGRSGGYLWAYDQPGLGPVDSPTAALSARLRAAFDPHGLCNQQVLESAD